MGDNWNRIGAIRYLDWPVYSIQNNRQEEIEMTLINTVLYSLAEDANRIARDKGWWDEERNDGEMIALMHSELSEALEALRHGNPPDDKIPKFSGVEAELADTIIRILDFAHQRGHDVAGALIAKMEYNKTRPHKHGGKVF